MHSVWSVGRWTRCLLAISMVTLAAAPVVASEEVEDLGALGEEAGRHALEPPDTSSPRATLRSFLENGRDAWKVFLATRNPDRTVYERARRRVQRAARCLDLSGIPPAARDEIGGRSTVLLLDVFERISMPLWRDIPDAAEVGERGIDRWVVPHTPIELERVKEGPRAGEFLFTPRTVSSAKEFYDLTMHLEPRANAVVDDGFSMYRTLPGWMIPLAWIRSLPAWARAEVFEQAIWQWVLLAIVLASSVVGLVLLRMWVVRAAHAAGSAGRRLVVPLVLLIGGYLFSGTFVRQIGFKGTVIIIADLAIQGIMILALALLVVRIVQAIAEWMLRSPRIHERSVDAHLVRLAVRVMSMLIGVLIIVEGARAVGLPIAGLVAGVGVGGVAVALAAQSTIENFIGSLTIFADRPVRVGDFCRFGNDIGTVEEIGLRSTRVRTLGRSVMTIPNAEFSRLRLDNYTQRDGNLFKAQVPLRFETTPQQVRDVLDRIRTLLTEHERVRDGARVRLIEIGESAFELEIFAVVEAPDWADFVGVREELLLAVIDLVDASGARLAVPARTTYLTHDPGGPEGTDPVVPA